MATTLPGTGTPISTDPLTTLNGVAASASEVIQRMKLSTGAAGTATDVSSANPVPTQITSGTTAAGVEPFGALIANAGYQTLFYDSWGTSPIDTTDKWTVTGTAPTIAGGNMQMAATASTYNAIRTKDAVRPNVGFTLARNGIQLETSAATGCGRFWGLGTPASVPAAMSLAQDGIGYEIDQAAGTLLAVTYAAGVRTTVATLTRPADGAIHAYGLYFRVTQAYWILDGAVVASQSFPNVQIVELPALIVRQNAAVFVGVPTFANIAHLTADTSRQGVLLADPVIGTRQARVSAAGALNVLQPDITASGTLAAAAQLVNLALNGQSSATIQITGTWVGTIQFEGTTGGVTFDPINGVFSSSSAPATTATVNGSYRVTPGSLASIQARMSAFTSGSATIAIRASAGTGGVFANQILPTKNTDGTSTQAIKAASTAAVAADQSAVVALHPSSPLPAGANVIGGVTGTFFQATQPVSLATNTPTLQAGSAVIGALTANQSVNTAQINGVAPLMGNGVSGTGSQRVNIASDNTAFAVNATLAAETTKVIGTVNVSAAQTIAAVTAITNALPTGTNSIGNLGTIATVTTVSATTPAASTTTAATLSSAATTNATIVKASAGNLYAAVASNVGAASAFLKLFNLATAPTVGTSVPFLTIPIAASGVVSIQFGTQGMRMATGIAFAITNLAADTDTTAVAAAQVKVAIAYI